ncbi:MAG: Phenylalanine-tRNA ligase beta subunit, partial [Candidatus Gottesmanbacteria bacterium GW2011_GWA1_47_8]
MDIKLPYSLLAEYIDTSAPVMKVVEALTLCGPTVDRVTPVGKDAVLDIEVITNRVDMASAFGIAREAAAILPQFGIAAKLKNNPYRNLQLAIPPAENQLPLKVQILDQSLVSRFSCLCLEDVVVGASAPDTVIMLEKAGLHSVNNVVDISNELTLRLGQPVHIFDYDKLLGNKMILRESRKGEKITTLDGRQHTLLGKDIVIEDGQGRLVDLCGIIGGQLSMVDENTHRVVLFVQTYEPKRIRRTSLYTQNRTLAAQIFEKNPDPALVIPTLNQGVALLTARTGAKVAGKLIDIKARLKQPAKIKLSLAWLNQLAGIEVSAINIRSILKRLGFTVVGNNTLTVSVPTWRVHDIKLKQDLAEEVLRVMGYFRWPSHFPCTFLDKFDEEPILRLETKIKHFLAAVGFCEVYNYSLVNKTDLAQNDIAKTGAIALRNPLSADYTHLRTSLIPGVLSALAFNAPLAEKLLIFELSNVYLGWDGEHLPEERPMLVLSGWSIDFRELKGYLESLFSHLHASPVTFRENDSQYLGPAADIFIDNVLVGHIGLSKPGIAHHFRLPVCPLVELDLRQVLLRAFVPSQYQPVSIFPPVVEEVTIASKLSVGELLA